MTIVRTGNLPLGKNLFLEERQNGCKSMLRFDMFTEFKSKWSCFIEDFLLVRSQGGDNFLQFIGPGQFQKNFLKVRMFQFCFLLQTCKVA